MARASQSLIIKKKALIRKHKDGQKRPVLVRKTGGRTITVTRSNNNYVTVSRRRIDYKGNTTFHKVVRAKRGR